MKSLILAAGLVIAGATAASAQFYPGPSRPEFRRDIHPYEARRHDGCQSKAIRLHDYERRSARDGIITREERRTIRALQYDLDRTCGRYRHNG
jgi:hypothetical protein